MRQCQKDSSGGFGILHLFWRSPLFISSPVSTVDEENPRDVASSMANGAIRRDPIAVKAGAISKQDRSARYAVLGTRCPRALLYQRGGNWRGEAGEGGVKCLRGSVWEWRRTFHLQTPPLAPQQHRAKTAPSTSQRHPPWSPFRPFRSGWPKLTRASVRHQSSRALPGSTPAN